MKKFILFFILLPFFSFSQKKLRDSVMIKSEIFEVVYSEILQQPKFVRYYVLCPNGTASRVGMDFYINDSVLTSDNKDYENNPYDKGHMAPAADFNCNKETLFKTFSFLNCSLQQQDLNRTTWRLLEVRERELALKHKVMVEIRIVFSNNSLKLPTGATVPDGYYKTINYNNISEKYFFKNEKPISTDFNKFIIK